MRSSYLICLIGVWVLLLSAQGCIFFRKGESRKAPTEVTEQAKSEEGAGQVEEKPAQAAVTNITADQLKKMIADKEDMIILDVRNPEELKSELAPIENAVNIPIDQLPARYAELPRDKKIVVVCRSGRRSAMAAGFLSQQGFTKVLNLLGGMAAYRQ